MLRASYSLGCLFIASFVGFGCASGGNLGTGGTGGSTVSTNPSTTGAAVTNGSGSTVGFGGAGVTSSTSGSASATSTGQGGQGGGCGGGCPPNSWDLDQNPLTGTCGCEYQCTKVSDTDPIDANYKDDNCDGGDGVVEDCIYVSASLGSDTAGTGTRMAPVKTIAHGIQTAQANQVPAVCVSGETYNENVTVVSGINMYGGFDPNDPNFPFKRSAAVVTTVNGTGVVFDAPTIGAETHIEGFTINANATTTSGDSTYGVRLGGGLGQLFVRYNVIHVAAGNSGAPGTDGAAASPANAPAGNAGSNGQSNSSNGGTPGAQPSCTEFGGAGGLGGYDSGSGANGSLGTGQTAIGIGGHADSAFECDGVTGNNVATGGAPYTINGGQGTAGSPGGTLGSVMGGLYAGAAGGNGTAGSDGKGGSGGGGGGGGDNGSLFCHSDRGGGGGSGGCGGLGGNFGRGGRGGGGSFAVFAATGFVTVTNNDMTTLGGGKGGKGGNGATGQQGGSGGPGGGGADDAGPGGSGGSGSNGGSGAPGGGGGGGPSACLGYGFGTNYTFTMNTSCTPGFPGQGGAAGTFPDTSVGNVGANGSGGTTLQIN